MPSFNPSKTMNNAETIFPMGVDAVNHEPVGPSMRILMPLPAFAIPPTTDHASGT